MTEGRESCGRKEDGTTLVFNNQIITRQHRPLMALTNIKGCAGPVQLSSTSAYVNILSLLPDFQGKKKKVKIDYVEASGKAFCSNECFMLF